jgi:DNA (cytosine-5)-methyltransferase 1
MNNTISMIELFSGIGAQERALRQLGLPYEVAHTCDCDKDAVLSYAAMRWDLEKEMETFEFPSQDKMIEELQAKNLGYDFPNEKHTITAKTPLKKLKQYYIADKLSRNLGDISKVERLPYAHLVTYSFPCTDLSVAGKGEGMVNKCDACGHSWPIDFSKAEEALVCPECGSEISSSTRSGLLGQVQRLLAQAHKDNELPTILLMENVKNLVGKKFKAQFDAWVKYLDSIGYNTKWKILNSKHYGIPQNRERCFAISILKTEDNNTFQFPEQITLETRLKDILEKNVSEKYYLPDDRIEKILNSTFMQEKKRIQTTDVCDTLLARDWKDPKCVPVEEELEPIRLGGLYDDENGKHQAGSIWDKDTISPTLDTMQGGNRQPFIVDEIKVVGNYMPSNHDASRVVDIDGIAPTVKENHGTVTAIAEPFVVASRGRNPENPSDRTTGAPTEQRLEPNLSGCTNTLTSVQKDNYVCVPTSEKSLWTDTQKQMITEDGNIKRYINSDVVDEFGVGDCADISFPNGYNKANRVFDGYSPAINGTTTQSSFIVKEPIIYDDYNSRVSSDQDAINTLTCNCGASAERNGVKIIEPVIVDDIYNNREPRLYDEYSPTLRSERTGLKVAEEDIKWRIRKLTPKECVRLMNFADSDYEAISKYVSNSAIYKQCGNSIVVSCLVAIMSSLFIKDGYKADVWTEYMLNYDD